MAIHTTTFTQRIAHSLSSWEWTKKLLYWIVMSAGTMSECAFLIASIYMSLNASVHSLVLVLVSEQTSVHIAELATAAYVALPECILCLAIVTVIGHARVWLYNREDKAAFIWTVLYGIPTVIFLVLSLVTLGCAVASADFRLPEGFIIVRALAGYGFALTSLLHMQLGVPQERERLQQKDDTITELRREKDVMMEELRQEKDATIAELRGTTARLQAVIQEQKTEMQKEIAHLNEIIGHQKTEMQAAQVQKEALLNEISKSSDDALHVYSDECINWLRGNHKTISIEDIVRLTGHHKRKITNAIGNSTLQTSTRNKELVLVSSLTSWLKETPPPASKTDGDTLQLHIVNG